MIKLMTELITESENSVEQTFLHRSKRIGEIIKTCLDEVLDDQLIRQLWDKSTGRIIKMVEGVISSINISRL